MTTVAGPARQHLRALRRGVDRARCASWTTDRQPCWWLLLPDRLEVRLDRARCAGGDPRGHAASLSAGAAVCAAEIGAAAAGLAVDVELRPDPADDLLVAVLRPADRLPDPRLAALDLLVGLRQCYRAGSDDEQLAGDLAADLATAATRAVEVLALSPEQVCRSTRWVLDAADRGRSRRVAPQNLTCAPARVALATAGDTVTERVRAGRALQLVLLQISRHGGAGGLVTGSVEVAAVRAIAERQVCPGRRLQALVHIGRGAPGTRPGPRRPLAEILYEHSATWPPPPPSPDDHDG